METRAKKKEMDAEYRFVADALLELLHRERKQQQQWQQHK